MSAITTADIKIETPVPLIDLQELSMEVTGNAHAFLSLKGFLSEDTGERALWGFLSNAPLRVWAGENLLFTGIISDAQVSHEGRGYGLQIQGSSATALLDCEEKSRSFQDQNSIYQEVMRAALEDTKGAALGFYAEDRRIGTPLYQLEETDWGFLKRLAALLGRRIYPMYLWEKPGVSIGLPQGRSHDGEKLKLSGGKVWFDRKRKSICREVDSYEDLSLGDRISWEGYTYRVAEKSCRLEKGLLSFHYRLAEKKEDYEEAYGNPREACRLLSGRVLETREEEIRVKLDIDRAVPENPYWYPWEPDAGNLLYCMPEKGERVYILPGDHIRERDRAVWGVHENGEGNPEMKVTDRYFTTADKKRMYLLPEKMGFLDLKGTSPLEVSLQDDSGAQVVSRRHIVVSARDTIGIKGSNLFFQAPKEVSLVRRDSICPAVINMCNGFDSIGAFNEVTMSGAGNEELLAFRQYRLEKGKEYSLEGLEKSVLASTPGRSLEGSVEKQVRGIQVDYIRA